MSVLPPDLKTALEEWCGLKVVGATSVSGGMINQAARVETSDGPVFVKWNESDTPFMLHQEAHGLEDIEATGTLRTPKVLGFHNPATWNEGNHNCRFRPPQYLVLEYIEQHPPDNPHLFAERFGRLLAQMHLLKHETRGFGNFEHDFIGHLPQTNEWRDTWVEFYRDCRILPQMEIARRLLRLSDERERLIMAVCERLPDLLQGLDSRPSLLHGDLWSGNYLTVGDEPVVIDPAVYYGEREMEIAFMELFGGFPLRLFEAYEEAFPMQDGYERRRALHQLYPLLVHLNHFGESYGPDVDRVCRQYLD